MKVKQKKARTHGRGTRPCRRCGSYRGIIRRADLLVCRRCLREIADDLGFKKTGARGG